MPPAVSSDALPREAYIQAVTIPFISHWSKIRCGSYTSEWIARVVGVKPPPANSILKGPLWFDMFRPILPYEMREIFRFNGMESKKVVLKKYSDAERLEWIKRQIVSSGRPPALLIRTKILHWIAVAGYDDAREVFYVYDSRFGNDSLDLELPIGNFAFSYSELLERWHGRSFLRYIAIVITDISASLPLV